MPRSNGVPFQIIQIAPLVGAGFEVHVMHPDEWRKLCQKLEYMLHVEPSGFVKIPGDPIPAPDKGRVAKPLPRFVNHARAATVISKFTSLSLTTEISGSGAGSVTMDLDDEFWSGTLANGQPATDLLEYEHLFHVYENGALRGAFLGANISEETVPAGNGTIRSVTISGPGPAEVLKWAVVMEPWYPNPRPQGGTTENPYRFKRVPVMAAWLILLRDAQKRGTIPFVCVCFDDKIDCGGLPWDDTPDPLQDPEYVTQILSGTITFFVDSHTLTEVGRDSLAGYVSHFNQMKAPQVTIVGHTDSTNTHAYNQALSERRAQAAAAKIKELYPPTVITAYGRGETEPIASNNTVRGREYNRRVVVTYPVGPPYVAESTYSPEYGRNLFELLEENLGGDFTSDAPLRAEWYMHPNFRLEIRKEFGTHRENEVIFYEGSTALISKNRERGRSDIRNLIAQQATGGGAYSIATDPASVKRWHQREVYEIQATTFNDEARMQIAQGKLILAKDETELWTVSVPPYADGRRVYEDYTLGDWVGISRYLGGKQNKVEAFRVLAITVNVDTNGEVALELNLQSKEVSEMNKLRARLASFLAKRRGAQVFVQDSAPTNPRVGDLWTIDRVFRQKTGETR